MLTMLSLIMRALLASAHPHMVACFSILSVIMYLVTLVLSYLVL